MVSLAIENYLSKLNYWTEKDTNINISYHHYVVSVMLVCQCFIIYLRMQ